MFLYSLERWKTCWNFTFRFSNCNIYQCSTQTKLGTSVHFAYIITINASEDDEINIEINVISCFLRAILFFGISEKLPLLCICRDGVRSFLRRWESTRNAVSESLHKFIGFHSAIFSGFHAKARKPMTIKAWEDHLYFLKENSIDYGYVSD